MSDWASYQLQDFIPFSGDVYFRLLARMGEDFWPLQWAFLALGIIALVVAIRGRARLALLLLALPWGFVAVAFFAQRYVTLNWAGDYLCWAWLLQGALLAGIAWSGFGCARARPRPSLSLLIGSFLVLIAFIGPPLTTLAAGGGWRQAEFFGLHPDPTALFTFGIALLVLRGPALWGVVLIPILWIVVSALTLLVLESPRAVALFAAVALGGVGLFCRSLPGRRDQ
ncbi:DUF6064 family protein [Microbulbifer mangrovi]|uniref:DUF6064 family protein n=1 Tax=Microbulbifer mangrovi TaxID=927787 RepID=UPI0009907B31|nr:DUF6064 family protein [Microbulbifer mangrovi]